jgi:hypothetical protein
MGRGFFASLALATALPLLIIPVIALTHAVDGHPIFSGAVNGAVALTCYGHVLSTLWFQADPDYRDIRKAHAWRMYGALLGLPVAAMLCAWLAPNALAWIGFALYVPWQAHHYTRQNLGILGFAAARDGAPKMTPDVRLALNLTTVAGTLAMLSIPDYLPGFLAPLQPVLIGLRVVGIGALAGAAALVALTLIKTPELRRAPRVLTFLGLSLLFYVPACLPASSSAVVFLPYAMAHGAQYLVFMGVTSARSRFGPIGLAALATGAMGLGWIAYSVPGPVGLYTGIIIWHFLADARLWRLSDPLPRAIVRRRFDFVFNRGVAPTPSVALAPAE